MKQIFVLPAAAVVSATLLSICMAQNGPPTPQQEADRAVKTRQGLFDVQAFAFGPVGAMLKDAPFDAAVVQKEAPRIVVTAGMISEVFQTDTRKFQVTTKARENIWSDQPGFQKKIKALQDAAAQLDTAGKSGDKAAVLGAAAAVGKACKSCHEDYREK